MNAHPTDSIPAFVLGALDPDELFQVSMHLSVCDTCRAEAEAFRSTIEALPFMAPLQPPPPRVKQQLFARVAAAGSQEPAARAPARARPRWPMILAAGTTVLALALGAMMVDARTQLDQMHTQLAQNQQALDGLRSQVAADKQLASFISTPQTVVRQLAGPDARARAMMYMQPANRRAMLVFNGMPALAQGKIYQLWLAKPGIQIPASVFEVDQNGMAMLAIEAPAPIDEYAQVMVTVEPSGGSAQPSNEIVLSGQLASAPFIFA
jgi:anti-sigma-K factor RskA